MRLPRPVQNGLDFRPESQMMPMQFRARIGETLAYLGRPAHCGRSQDGKRRICTFFCPIFVGLWPGVLIAGQSPVRRRELAQRLAHCMMQCESALNGNCPRPNGELERWLGYKVEVASACKSLHGIELPILAKEIPKSVLCFAWHFAYGSASIRPHRAKKLSDSLAELERSWLPYLLRNDKEILLAPNGLISQPLGLAIDRRVIGEFQQG